MKKKVIKEVKSTKIKQEIQPAPKFHYLDEAIVVNGFFGGISGRIVDYSLINSEYHYLVEFLDLNDNVLSRFFKESELELLYCDCEECDEEEKDEIIEIFRDMAYDNLPRYKKLFIKKTDLFPYFDFK